MKKLYLILLSAFVYSNSSYKTHAVGTKQPNELGIYDMSGNVEEWCQDRYAPYDSSPQTNPIGGISGAYRVHRGGAFSDNTTRACRSACRKMSPPDSDFYNLGFRLALSE